MKSLSAEAAAVMLIAIDATRDCEIITDDTPLTSLHLHVAPRSGLSGTVTLGPARIPRLQCA